MTDSVEPNPDTTLPIGGRGRPRAGTRIGHRFAALRAGFGPQARGFVSKPVPRITGSAARGRQYMAGNFRIDGKLVHSDAKTPWGLTTDSPGFIANMHGFHWLDDLASIAEGDGRETARLWLSEWIDRYGRGAGPGWTPDLTGRRQIRLITHALFLMNGMEAKESARLYDVLGRHAQFLMRRWQFASPGLPRFEAITGLIYSACTLMGLESFLNRGLNALAEECATEIDATGGIITRNPEELLEVFVLLTWVAQILGDTGKPPDPAVDAAITRIAPTLRSLRHTDGALVRAHGGGRGVPGRLVTALVQSRVRPSYVRGLAMGFARLASDRVSLIVDAAPPMLGPRSVNAHAGTLGMELTSGSQAVIVSCGSGVRFGPEWRRAGRATVSHSTLSLEGYSSARLPARSINAHPDAQYFESGPTNVSVQQSVMRNAEGITLSHDGWRESHGLLHLRSLTLEDDGSLLRGEDGLAALNGSDRAHFDRMISTLPPDIGLRYTVRFHLHPDIEPTIDMGGGAVSLRLPNNEVWVFRHIGEATLTIRPSVYLDSGRLRPRATKQIVLSNTTRRYGSAISWTLARPTTFLPAPARLEL